MRKLIFVLLASASQLALAADDITVLVLNDFHGQMQANKSMAGAGKISTFIQQYRKQYPNSVVVLAGDNYQGTAISNISYGMVDNEFFNHIGVKYSAIGNHDFDYGQAVFESWNRLNKFSFLAANVVTKDNQVFSSAKPYGEIKLASGKKIAFVGLSTLETAATTGAQNLSGLTVTNPATAANKWVEYLNSSANKQGRPDTIALLTHLPSEQESTGKILYSDDEELGTSEIDYVTKKVSGISALISGHSHKVVSGYLNGVAVVQGGSQGKDLSVLHYDCHSQPKCVVVPEVINLAEVTKNLQSDPVVDKIIDKYYQQNQAILNQVIAKSPQALNNIPESGLYNINLTYTIADILRKKTGSDIGLQNTYGIRRSLPSGEINYSMLYETMPFDNTLVTLNVSGDILRKLIEHSLPLNQTQLAVFTGVKINLNSKQQIQSILINGIPLDNKKIYSIATINFLITGGDGFDFSAATNVHDTNIPIRDVIKHEWESNGIKVSPDWQSITTAK